MSIEAVYIGQDLKDRYLLLHTVTVYELLAEISACVLGYNQN